MTQQSTDDYVPSMTLDEFRMHRPRLAKLLVAFVGLQGSIISILPEHGNDELFSAMIRDTVGDDRIAVCVSSNHPSAMREEEGPGQATWWWEDDLNA